MTRDEFIVWLDVYGNTAYGIDDGDGMTEDRARAALLAAFAEVEAERDALRRRATPSEKLPDEEEQCQAWHPHFYFLRISGGGIVHCTLPVGHEGDHLAVLGFTEKEERRTLAPAEAVLKAERERDALRAERDSLLYQRGVLMEEGDLAAKHLDASASRATRLVAILHPARVAAAEDEEDGSPICAECGDTYSLDPGADPSPECHPCAQKILAAARAALREDPEVKP